MAHFFGLVLMCATGALLPLVLDAADPGGSLKWTLLVPLMGIIGFLLGFLEPRRFWIWGLLIGVLAVLPRLGSVGLPWPPPEGAAARTAASILVPGATVLLGAWIGATIARRRFRHGPPPET